MQTVEFLNDDITKLILLKLWGFVQLFGTTYLTKVHTQKIGYAAEIWAFEVQTSPY